MEAILQWGLDCIRLIQTGANPPLTACMKIITAFGSAAVYIIVLPLMYWCVDEKKCLRLGTTVLISVWLNIALKLALDQPRPFFEGYDPSVGMIGERMGGFPSGHAQNSLVMWAIIASWGKQKRLYGIVALFCLLIGFSRIYLGVHFPTDVFGGWIIGGILLAVYFLAGKRIGALLAAHSPRAGLVACAALAFAMILYRPSAELLMPGAIILGLGTGYYLCRFHIGFTASALSGRVGVFKYLTLAVRLLLGMTVVVLLFVLTEKIMVKFHGSGNYPLLMFLRFALFALWVSAGAPWLFRSLRLAENNAEN
ncbi:MAG: phosphatase PAP2 family protein [Treponema sp.]|jgi:membrane-associated phospholipid phosphatase|nr:phosphatase PAP2 family protein [Treponema sp.]